MVYSYQTHAGSSSNKARVLSHFCKDQLSFLPLPLQEGGINVHGKEKEGGEERRGDIYHAGVNLWTP